jgi:hypothetical protein
VRCDEERSIARVDAKAVDVAGLDMAARLPSSIGAAAIDHDDQDDE